MLCQADNVETGAMWECPLLLELNQTEAKPKPSEQSTRGIQSIHDSHTHLATPSGKAPTFKETHTQGGQTDKAVESQPGNFQETFGRSEPQPVASTSGKAAAGGSGVSLLSRQLGGMGLAGREDTAHAGAEAQQPSPQQQQQHTHLLCISPDAPINPVLYWLGAFDQQNTKFILEGAKGPLKLDLGDILYAPNLMIDGQVRVTAKNPAYLLPWRFMSTMCSALSSICIYEFPMSRAVVYRNSLSLQQPAVFDSQNTSLQSWLCTM